MNRIRCGRWIFMAAVILALFSQCRSDRSEFYIAVVSGNYQKAAPGQVLPAPVVIRVNRSDQSPAPGVETRFSIALGGGSLDVNGATTDTAGEARVRWGVGGDPDQLLMAAVEDAHGNRESAFAFANTQLVFFWQWTSGIDYYRNLMEKVDHDGRILQSDNVLIFSDASGDEAKAIFAKYSEEVIAELIASFAVSSCADLGIDVRDNGTKIAIYSNCERDQDNGTWIGKGHPAIMLDAVDSPRMSRWPGYRQFIRRGLKHELTHYLQMLLLDWKNSEIWPPFWFNEGIAEHLSGGTCPVIETRAQFLAWIQNPGHMNPLNVEEWANFRANDVASEYYTMFGLVLRYLVHPQGLGKTCIDLKNMFVDMRSSRDFAASFEKCMGISVSYLKENLYALLDDFMKRVG